MAGRGDGDMRRDGDEGMRREMYVDGEER